MVPSRVVSVNWDSIRWSHVLVAASNENPQINVTTHISAATQILPSRSDFSILPFQFTTILSELANVKL